MHKNSDKALSVMNLTHFFDEEKILENLNFDIYTGEFVSLIGSSGSGKTTLLNIISGLITPYQGTVLYNNLETSRLGKFTYVHQQDTLLPWRNALDNVLLGLEIKGEIKRTSINKAMNLFEEFGLSDSIYKMPWQLSGGMKQRVALLRSMLTENNFLLLDEPFASLDAITRMSLQKWLKKILYNYKRTVLLVTHDINEAILLSNRIIVFKNNTPGKFQEIILKKDFNNEEDMIIDKDYLLIRKKIMESLSFNE